MAKPGADDFMAKAGALLDELGVKAAVKKAAKYTLREERIIAGFEEIQRFVEENGRLPSMYEDRDIFERIYATRLEQIKSQADCQALLKDMDWQELLTGRFEGRAGADGMFGDGMPGASEATGAEGEISTEELLAELGVGVGVDLGLGAIGAGGADDITRLHHVKSQAERAIKNPAEEIATRSVCEEFDRFKPYFDRLQRELAAGMRKTERFRKNAGFVKTDIRQGRFFIIGGQVGYVAEMGPPIKAPNGETDARLRVVYANGTESSNILLRSVLRAMYNDETSRLVSDPAPGPLFSDTVADEDRPSGTIYVLKSKSEDATVKQYRHILHKIGVTGGSVERRIANAAKDPTFLLAEVEIVRTYRLFGIHRGKWEKLLHRFFAPARCELAIKDRFGNPVTPKEWFLVPLPAIGEAVERIRDETIGDYYYDPKQATLVKYRPKN